MRTPEQRLKRELIFIRILAFVGRGLPSHTCPECALPPAPHP